MSRIIPINVTLETVFVVKCGRTSIPINRCERCPACLDTDYEHLVVFCGEDEVYT